MTEPTTIKRILKITLANQVIVDLVIEGSPELMQEIQINGWKIKEEITQIILNGIKLKAQTLFRDEK